jgi:hypothetical protein
MCAVLANCVAAAGGVRGGVAGAASRQVGAAPHNSRGRLREAARHVRHVQAAVVQQGVGAGLAGRGAVGGEGRVVAAAGGRTRGGGEGEQEGARGLPTTASEPPRGRGCWRCPPPGRPHLHHAGQLPAVAHGQVQDVRAHLRRGRSCQARTRAGAHWHQPGHQLAPTRTHQPRRRSSAAKGSWPRARLTSTTLPLPPLPFLPPLPAASAPAPATSPASSSASGKHRRHGTAA